MSVSFCGKLLRQITPLVTGTGSWTSAPILYRTMSSSASPNDNLAVEHDKTGRKFFIKLGEAEAKLEYVEGKGDGGNTVLNMWHTEVPPQLQGRGIAKILAKEAFDYVVSNKLKMQLTCSYLQKYYHDNPSDKYKDAVV